MNFLIYDEDGRITQSNKVYSPEGYDKTLNDLGHMFVAVDHAGVLHMDDVYVANGAPLARPEMPCVINKTEFKADGNDAARISGLPKPCRVTVTATGGLVLANNETINTGFVEIPSPVPAEYVITVDAWPHKTLTVKVRAS